MARTGKQKTKVEKVLVVDDETEILESLKRHFEFEGIESETCTNAVDALEEIRNNSYNIVLTDIRMPGMDGIELLKTIKGKNPLCIVIIMTAYSNMSYLLECFGAGASDYFSKPFHDIEILVDEVKSSLKKIERWKKGMGFEGFPGTP